MAASSDDIAHWPNDQLDLFQRLVIFFAEPADRQCELIADFSEERYFDTAEGHIKTLYPVEILLVGLKYWAGHCYNYATIVEPYYNQLDRLVDIITIIEQEGYAPANWKSAYWSVAGLTGYDKSGTIVTPSSGLWDELRSACRHVKEAMPAADHVLPGEMETLLHNV